MNNSNDGEFMPLGRIPKFLRTEYGFTISRQTAHNWASLGVNGSVLPTVVMLDNGRFPLRKMASKTAIRDFVGGLSPTFIELSRRRA